MADEEDSGCLSLEELNRMDEKIRNLPTLKGLLEEKDHNARLSEEELVEISTFVQEILDAKPKSELDILKTIARLRKKYKKTYQKSDMLGGYRYLQSKQRKGCPPQRVGRMAFSSTSSPLSHAPTGRRPGPTGLLDVEDVGDVMVEGAVDAGMMPSELLESYLVSKAPRSQSGVLVVTVFTSPYPDGQAFSCKWNCYYCPNEPGQPRSYLLNEPGVRRANRMEFDPVRQFNDRVSSLVAIGHPADKVELLVLGGTWESYPESYRETFVRDLFYAANCFSLHQNGVQRKRLSLLEEQLANETAQCKVIGLTLETRPDTIQPEVLVTYRQLGCTRVQLGVQHTDNGILQGVHRQATREDTVRAIKLLKDSCFKVDIHLMPDLPGSTPEADKAMFEDVLYSPELQADQWKIYPCQTTPFTVIERWYREGKYKSYGLEALMDVILDVKKKVHPWIRLNRVIRDIPVDYVLAGVEVANLRQLLGVKLRQQGERCRCIRCREIKADKDLVNKLKGAQLVQRTYEASEGTEVFISVETPEEEEEGEKGRREEGERIFGFLRLRMHVRGEKNSPNKNEDDEEEEEKEEEDEASPFPELRGCALIRELHVYGNLVPTVGSYTEEGGGGSGGAAVAPRAQHTGIGTQLLLRAERIARENGYKRIAVISGVGVRGYYRKRGYHLHSAQRGAFLFKVLSPE